MQILTRDQQRAADRFVKAENAMQEARARTAAERAAAFGAALDVGVQAATLARMAGISNARAYQMRAEIRPNLTDEGTNDGR